MLRGFYTAASGMLTQQRRTEMLANNLANVHTPGFKEDRSSLRAFPEMLLQRIDEQSTARTIGELNTGVYMQETIPKFLQGDLTETELNTDLALLDVTLPVNPETGVAGSVFFSVEGADGEVRYTRNGNFTLDGAGFLTTVGGHYVLDQNGGRIQLESNQFTVDEAGFLTGSNGENVRISVAFAENPMTLVKEGDGLFVSQDGELPDAYNIDGIVFRTQQGFLERSNVNSAQTMTDMMTSYRAFEANQKVLQAYDTSLQKTVNEVGKIG